MVTKCPKCNYTDYRVILDSSFYQKNYNEIVYCICLKCGNKHKLEHRLKIKDD